VRGAFDGAAVRSCQIFAVQVDGMAVTTVEGITFPGGKLSPVQEGLRSVTACNSLAAQWVSSRRITALLRDNPQPAGDELRESRSGSFAGAPAIRASSTLCTPPPR
jgi:aerobic carbon-monoxide dehydrogenase small subunit